MCRRVWPSLARGCGRGCERRARRGWRWKGSRAPHAPTGRRVGRCGLRRAIVGRSPARLRRVLADVVPRACRSKVGTGSRYSDMRYRKVRARCPNPIWSTVLAEDAVTLFINHLFGLGDGGLCAILAVAQLIRRMRWWVGHPSRYGRQCANWCPALRVGLWQTLYMSRMRALAEILVRSQRAIKGQAGPAGCVFDGSL